jgi:hypothetical protein
MRALFVVALFGAGCLPPALDDGDPTDPGGLVRSADEDGGGTQLTVGGTARVTADSLNLRDGVGTSANILTAMPCGASVQVLGGPSTTPASGWWNVTYDVTTGWASGQYLIPEDFFTPDLCGGGAPSTGGNIQGTTVDDIFARAKLAVGYSYYWGHGSWRADGSEPGSCAESCPSCTHSGVYGADCSGFVAKAWQVPAPSALESDQHPYSTANFYSDTTHWKPVPRSSLQPADALVHRTATTGHITLVETTTDPFGQIWLYEARGCSTGVVHDLRSLDSTYIAIRRDGL